MRDLNVLITGAGGPLGQSIMKAARHAALPCRIVAIDRNPHSVGFYWADSHHVLPSAERAEYLVELGRVCREEHIDAVLVGSEAEMNLLSRVKGDFERETGARVVVSPPEVLRISADKWETVQFLAERGLDHPRSALPENTEELERLVQELDFPLIVKPRSGSGSKDLYRVRDRAHLDHVLHLVHRPVVQEYLHPDDQEYTVAVFVDSHGEPQGSIALRRELAAGLTYRASVDGNPALGFASQAIAGALRPLGPCNVQLRLTERGPVPFEINARFSSTTSIRAHLGYNEVELALRCFVLGEQVTPPRPRQGSVLRYWEEMYLPYDAELATDQGAATLSPLDARRRT